LDAVRLITSTNTSKPDCFSATMDDPFRPRGIYRPKAQRLSISLAPLVAQRSLLFRVQTDMAVTTKTNYGELTPTEESPALYTLTPSASAKLMSAALSVLSAMSSASVYSQDSWRPGSAFVPVVSIDPRRHAIAFSPNMQWSHISEGSDGDSDSRASNSSTGSSLVVRTPPSASAAPVFVSIAGLRERLQEEGIHIQVSAVADSTKRAVTQPFPVKLEVSLPVNESTDHNEVPAAGPSTSISRKLQKKKSDNRLSRHSKALGKRVITHLSMQPSSKKQSKTTEKENQRKTMDIVHFSPEYQLPELAVQLSPINMPFVTARSPPGTILAARPSYPTLRAPAFPTKPLTAPRGRVQTPSILDAQAMERVQLIHSVMPPPLPPMPTLNRSTTPPLQIPSSENPRLAGVPARKGHRRYKSSPAVTQFDFNKHWDVENMPPLPPMPPVPQMPTQPRTPGLGLSNPPTSARPRAKSVSMAARPQGMVIRAVSPPFPAITIRQQR